MDMHNDTRFLTRFFKKVDTTGDCHIWTGAKDTGGYGCLNVYGKTKTAHRIAYLIAHPEWDGALQVDHTCHDRACVNPEHLRLVTPKQNSENRKGSPRHARTGIRGVSWHSQSKKWWAKASHNGQFYSAGLYTSIEEAEQAAIALRNRLFTHNIIDRRAS